MTVAIYVLFHTEFYLLLNINYFILYAFFKILIFIKEIL